MMRDDQSSTSVRGLYLGGLLAAYAATVARAIRWPNDWAEAHWLIGYQFGFVKRGLPGFLLSPFTTGGSAETVIRLAATLILVVFSALILLVSARIVRRSDDSPDSVLVVLAFLTSTYVVMTAHINGYYDHIVGLISILACWFVLRDHPWIASLLLSVGFLVHESIFVVGFPSVVLVALMCHVRRTRATTTRDLITTFLPRVLPLVVLPAVCLAAILLHQSLFLDTQTIGMDIARYLQAHEFVGENRHVFVAYALTSSFARSLENQLPELLDRILRLEFLIITIVPAMLMVWYGWRRFRRVRFATAVLVLFVSTVFVPLSLHAVAWDTSRIWTYPLFAAFLGVWGAVEIFGNDRSSDTWDAAISCSALGVILLQVFATTELMDGLEERYPGALRIVLYAPAACLVIAGAALQWLEVRRHSRAS